MNNIKTLRKANGLTQTQLGEKIEADQSSISKWELGLCLPEPEKLIKMAEIFNVSTDYVLGISRYHYPVNVGVDNLFTYEELEIIEDFRKLGADSKETLKRTLKAFVNSEPKN